jgi:hypothetical protein
MSDIFLSYKTEDKARAQNIAEALEKKGYSVWWDRVIPPGRRFSEVIQEELDAAKCVVVLWSKDSARSKWVETEASEGDRRGILVPVLIDDVRPPLAFRMIEAAKLIDWDGSLSNNEFDLLSKSVAGILASSESAKIEIHPPHEPEKTERKKNLEERRETEVQEKSDGLRNEDKTIKQSVVKEGYQPSLQTNEVLSQKSYRISWTIVLWLGWAAYTFLTDLLISSGSRHDNTIGMMFLPNVFVVVLANIFTLKKYKLAPQIFMVASLVQIGMTLLILFVFYDVNSGLAIILNLAIASVLYYFSRVSKTLIKEEI